MEHNHKPSLFRQAVRGLGEVILKKLEDVSTCKPSSLFLQVVRELREAIFKKIEDYTICSVIGSYPNEKFDQVVEWTNEVDKLIKEVSAIEGVDKSVFTNPEWCKNMISRIRDLCAKRRASNDSINAASLSLRQQLYREIVLLINITSARWRVYSLTNDLQLPKPEGHKQLLNEANQFLSQTKLQLQQNIPEANSDWYHNKIAETRRLVDKCEPRFSLQSQGVGSFSIKLHEELRCEIRLLANLYWVDLSIVIDNISNDPYVDGRFKTELEEWIKEADQFCVEIWPHLEEKNGVNDSSWYHKMIAETMTLIGKRYLAFPLQSQDVGSSSINSKALPDDDVGYRKHQYDFFLSFRGEDTRHGFTKYLYDALLQEGFKVFMDDEGLQSGDSISKVLKAAIENSKFSIIVFSENFADSTWCLDEVVKILDCREKNNQYVWPVFYKVEPSDVRYQKNSYEKALIKQETRFGKDSDKVKNWRSALYEVCDLKAFHYKKNTGYEGDFIQQIIKGAKKIRDHI